MVSEEAAHRALLFFYFGFLNDKLTLQSATAASRKWKALLNDENRLNEVDFVRISFSIWKSKSHKVEMLAVESSVCQLPEGISISSWREFKKKSCSEEFLAVIWAKILCFSPLSIAEGLNVTEGTVRYRLSSGLRKLGQICGGTGV